MTKDEIIRINAQLQKENEELRAANEAFGKRQEWWNERMVALEAQRDALLKALRMWLHLHDSPAGYEGKYGKALDAAIAAQQVKIDAAANASRAAIAAVEGEGK